MCSLRLKKILELIPDGVGVADIGTDHAQIPIQLAQRTTCSPIIAGEKNIGPFKIAKLMISDVGLENKIDLRLGSGLTILRPGEVEWVVIAGMGFKTLIEILEDSEEVARSVSSLVLQPMQGPDVLRHWLRKNRYKIIDEWLVKEDDKLFQIIQIQSGPYVWRDEIFDEVGPILFKKRNPYLVEHVEALITYHKDVLDKISLNKDTKNNKKCILKIAKLNEKIVKLQEVLVQCLKKSSE